MAADALAIVGLIRNAQGIRGEVVVESLTDAPDAIFASGRRVLMGDSNGNVKDRAETLTIDTVRPFKGGFMVKFDTVADRNEAELLRGRYLLLPFEELDPLEEDEVYLHDLVGMKVVLDSGQVIGDVTAYYELPQGLTLDVRTATGSVLVPYRPEVIERTDTDARTVIVKAEVGMFD